MTKKKLLAWVNERLAHLELEGWVATEVHRLTRTTDQIEKGAYQIAVDVIRIQDGIEVNRTTFYSTYTLSSMLRYLTSGSQLYLSFPKDGIAHATIEFR